MIKRKKIGNFIIENYNKEDMISFLRESEHCQVKSMFKLNTEFLTVEEVSL